jgi:hypothetical protein
LRLSLIHDQDAAGELVTVDIVDHLQRLLVIRDADKSEAIGLANVAFTSDI